MGARTVVAFTKLASAGPISISGLRVGDAVVKVVDNSTYGDVTAAFAGFVLVDGELLQTGPDESDPLPTVTALIEREIVF